MKTSQPLRYTPFLAAGFILFVFTLVLAACGSPAQSAAPTATRLPTPAVQIGWEQISVQEAAAHQAGGAFMLDVRQPEEWEQAHIAGATLIPLGELQGRLNEVPKDQEIVVICHSGNRSKTGADILAKAGYTNVSSVQGGIVDWVTAGYPVVAGK
jgi:rhodanese-related sulfurtransferase